MRFNVQTYDDNNGHGRPVESIDVQDGQGLSITLPGLEDAEGDDKGREPNIYIEKRGDGRWTINVSPLGDEIETVVEIDRKGKMTVKGLTGEILLEKEPS